MMNSVSLGDVLRLMMMTLRDPSRAVSILRGLNLPMQARWMLLALVVVLDMLFALLMVLLLPAPPGADETAALGALLGQPILIAVLQAASLLMIAGVMAKVGQMFGGRGNFADALLLVAWIAAIMLAMQIVLLLMAMIVPALSGYVTLGFIAILIWLMATMARELHGFSSLAMVIFGTIGTILVVSLILSVLLAMLGVMPEVPAGG